MTFQKLKDIYHGALTGALLAFLLIGGGLELQRELAIGQSLQENSAYRADLHSHWLRLEQEKARKDLGLQST